MTNSESRLEPTERTKIAVWAAAAGRCTFCNCLVLENEDLGEAIPIGELAHNVGWGEMSPRGKSDLSPEQRRQADNLLLLCRNCHKPIDQDGVIGRYTFEVLAQLKRDHEHRIRDLTAIGSDRKATIVRVVGPVRGVSPELTYDTVLGATTAAKFFPALLPGSFRSEYDLDLRQVPDFGTPQHFESCAAYIDQLVSRIHDGVRHNDIARLAVFGFARIPILVQLGARLDDKVSTLIFQRQRVDDVNAWRWPENPPNPPAFDIRRTREGSDPQRVALVVNVSGTIGLEDLPNGMVETHSVYILAPTPPSEPDPTLISSPAALTNFDHAVRKFLAMVEAAHGTIDRVDLFAAIPVSAAITLGRVLMPHVSPAWMVFDRDEQRRFFQALEVRR